MTRANNRKRWFRILALATLAAAAAFLRPAASKASDVGVRMGYYFDAEAFSMGIGLLTSLDRVGEWYFNPNAEIAMGDNSNLGMLNADFHYDFDTQSSTAVWVGAGPALLITDPERDGADTDVDPALNMFVGVGAKEGAYRPFAQLKGIMSDNSDIGLSVGIRF